ncbi:unnamed protein product [Caenorhabditis auriculariae]|uniref:Uncharacterized protein n=1 Tax=Caenorhabditis auriculariae TaxID=2777116 RepID=A0A8S1GWV3_9PELO|nr:unnamed protein product [Caenorhabditis auriculariae]
MQKFHRSISQVTGSTEKLTLFAPFHTIIGASEDNSGALKNIKRICSSVRAWESCVRSCSRDDAREILLSSMNQWKNFCAIVRKPSRDTDEYFNCERENQQYVSQNCQHVICGIALALGRSQPKKIFLRSRQKAIRLLRKPQRLSKKKTWLHPLLNKQ